MFNVHLKISLLVIYLIINVCDCIEEFAPEVYLNPRNFNPHPYQTGYISNHNNIINNNNNNEQISNVNSNGPVLFPVTRDDNVVDDNGNNNNRQVEVYYRNLINDEHPYASVSRKNMIQSGQVNKETRVNPEIYKALTMHAAKILNVPARNLNLQNYNDNNGEQYVNAIPYGFVPQNSYQLQLKNFEYDYVIPNDNTHKPIHEVENYNNDDVVNINNKISKEKLHYEYDNVHNVEPILEYAKPVQRRFYDVDNTKYSLYNGNDKGYSQIYIKTPKFRLLQKQSHISG